MRQTLMCFTSARRCSDWFVLRQFRITGKNAGAVLIRNEELRTALGLESPADRQNRTLGQWLQIIFNSLFSSKVFTESIKRGSANETAVGQVVRKIGTFG